MERRTSAEALKPAELHQLREAHRRLREAVADYEERFLGSELASQEAPAQDVKEMSNAQAKIEVAETDLWQLREELLGWHRPAGAPSALESIDWFSEEDRAYDEISVDST
ncbi:MAG: hypothetical protein ACRDIU_00975 [Actinomycetota bacterium]